MINQTAVETIVRYAYKDRGYTEPEINVEFENDGVYALYIDTETPKKERINLMDFCAILQEIRSKLISIKIQQIDNGQFCNDRYVIKLKEFKNCT